MHKDASLTTAESLAPPLDPLSALFLDVDGTLLEIAPRPELVQVPKGLPPLIVRLSAEREGALALISGRPLAQLDRLFQPWQGAAAGLHGLERRRADGILDCVVDGASAAAIDSLRPKLAALAADGTGLTLEDKGGTLALHYRAAPQREPEIRTVVEALHREVASALRLITGKMVVEFQPRSADKGLAIAAFLAEPPFVGRRPVFVGDDTTDEDGFAEIRRQGGVAVRVGCFDGATAAKYHLPTVEAVLAWLASSGLR
ncbi:MAG TPA: trehalose-phosphatase [Stellaceae bacterium]|jgi:trehalose 6-phosphate phosphatase|nr:trehalose-phosphatase [Stellaceae bacterium]